MQIVSVSGAVDEEQGIATTAFIRRDPIVLWNSLVSQAVFTIAGKAPTFSSHFHLVTENVCALHVWILLGSKTLVPVLKGYGTDLGIRESYETNEQLPATGIVSTHIVETLERPWRHRYWYSILLLS
jgi:hypothetical protein